MTVVVGNTPSMASARSARHRRGTWNDCAQRRLTTAAATEFDLVDGDGLGNGDVRAGPDDEVQLVTAVELLPTREKMLRDDAEAVVAA